MSFFHKHINWFYIVPLIIGCVFYLILRSVQTSIIAYFAFGFFLLGLIMLCYASWYKVFKIYKDYIYLSPQVRQEIEYRKKYELGYFASYEEEKKFKKSLYIKSLIFNIIVGIISLFVIIYAIVRFCS